MKISLDKSQYHRFSFTFEYNPQVITFCRAMRDTVGWKEFSYEDFEGKKRWIFSLGYIAEVIKSNYPFVEIEPQVVRLLEYENGVKILEDVRTQEIEEVKNKVDTNFRVRGLKGEPYSYQNVGMEFLATSGGRAIICDQMGTGKTLQTLGYIVHKRFTRSLVVVPASVKIVWQKEIKKWTRLSSVIIDSKTDLNDIDPSVEVRVINFELLKKFLPQLLKTRFDCLVGDEAHLLKSPSAIRTKAFRRLSQVVSSVVLLTGTPLLSRPVELFSLLNIIDSKNWDNYYEYTRRYCGGHQGYWGYDASGATNIEELSQKIKRYFLRRLKKDVLSELPPKNRIMLPVELDREAAKRYDEAEASLATYLKKYSGKQPREIAKTLQAEKLAQLNVLRMLTTEGKIPTAIELIDSIIDAGEKVIVFSSFIEPLRKLNEHYKGEAVVITGETDMEERSASVDAFQNDPKVKVFLGGIKSAGVGLTLTAASNVVFLDFSWNPADHNQGEDRIHRPGQTATSVNIYQLYAEGTIDEKMQKLLDKKQKIFDRLIEGEAAGEEDKDETMTETLAYITDKHR